MSTEVNPGLAPVLPGYGLPLRLIDGQPYSHCFACCSANRLARRRNRSSFRPRLHTWQAQNNYLPAIKLEIENSKTQVSGTLTFYFEERSHASEPWHINKQDAGSTSQSPPERKKSHI